MENDKYIIIIGMLLITKENNIKPITEPIIPNKNPIFFLHPIK